MNRRRAVKLLFALVDRNRVILLNGRTTLDFVYVETRKHSRYEELVAARRERYVEHGIVEGANRRLLILRLAPNPHFSVVTRRH